LLIIISHFWEINICYL